MAEKNANNTDMGLISEADHRIDWERKRKRKRQDQREPLEVPPVAEEDALIAEVLEKTPDDKHKHRSRKKKRHLVYDESRGTVVVKRKRRRGADRVRPAVGAWDDWDDE